MQQLNETTSSLAIKTFFLTDISGIMYWLLSTRPGSRHFPNHIQFCVAIWDAERSNLVFVHDRTNAAEYLQATFRTHLRELSKYYFVPERPT